MGSWGRYMYPPRFRRVMATDKRLEALSSYEEAPRYLHLEPAQDYGIEILSRPVFEGTQHPTIFEVLVTARNLGEYGGTVGIEGKWSVSSKRLAADITKHLGTDPAKWPGSHVEVRFEGQGFDRTWSVKRVKA